MNSLLGTVNSLLGTVNSLLGIVCLVTLKIGKTII